MDKPKGKAVNAVVLRNHEIPLIFTEKKEKKEKKKNLVEICEICG